MKYDISAYDIDFIIDVVENYKIGNISAKKMIEQLENYFN